MCITTGGPPAHNDKDYIGVFPSLIFPTLLKLKLAVVSFISKQRQGARKECVIGFARLNFRLRLSFVLVCFVSLQVFPFQFRKGKSKEATLKLPAHKTCAWGFRNPLARQMRRARGPAESLPFFPPPSTDKPLFPLHEKTARSRVSPPAAAMDNQMPKRVRSPKSKASLPTTSYRFKFFYPSKEIPSDTPSLGRRFPPCVQPLEEVVELVVASYCRL